MKIKYSPDAREQLKQIKRNAGDRITGKILKAVNRLADNPWLCPTIEKMLGIPSPYHFLHMEHNYVFYRIDGENIFITAIYNEWEDFMWRMFGVRLRTQESKDFYAKEGQKCYRLSDM